MTLTDIMNTYNFGRLDLVITMRNSNYGEEGELVINNMNYISFRAFIELCNGKDISVITIEAEESTLRVYAMVRIN